MSTNTESSQYYDKIITIIKDAIKYLPNWSRFSAIVSHHYQQICYEEEGVYIQTYTEIKNDKLLLTGYYRIPFDLRWHTIDTTIDLNTKYIIK